MRQPHSNTDSDARGNEMFYLDAPPSPRRKGATFRCVFPPEPTLNETQWMLCTFEVVSARGVPGKIQLGVTVIDKVAIDDAEVEQLRKSAVAVF